MTTDTTPIASIEQRLDAIQTVLHRHGMQPAEFIHTFDELAHEHWVRDEHVAGHVRMPGYIRGKHGVVISQSPVYPFPDAHAHGLHAQDEPTYDVRFEANHLWPQGAEDAQVHVAVFESYLERLT